MNSILLNSFCFTRVQPSVLETAQSLSGAALAIIALLLALEQVPIAAHDLVTTLSEYKLLVTITGQLLITSV